MTNLVSEGEEEETREQGQPTKSLERGQQQPKVNRLKQLKRTYRASQGSPLVRSKGEGSQHSDQSDRSEWIPMGLQQLDQSKSASLDGTVVEVEAKKYKPLVGKPFASLLNTLSPVKGQYEAL